MDIRTILEQIGIHNRKADVYLACLELGRATAYLIAKKTGLKRPTVYDIINHLMKEGLVSKSMSGNIKYFYPADPQVLLRKVQEKEKNIRSILPDLENLYNSPKLKPFIRYFEGREGIKEMYEDSLKSLKKGDEILAYVGEDVLHYVEDYAIEYVKRRVEKGVRLRGIYKKEKNILEHMQFNQQQLREAKILDEKYFPLNNETNIYKNKIAIASYGKEMFGMIIESAEIAKSQKAIFELAWKGAESLEK